ncbi:Carbonic anhydrase [Frankia canadensis]|uniref:carbonic anhydrase n=1 Tax=Frankia canadensis TaxID=1836972 RepID=A0A2I2KNU9_9ACTN|nr:carbonic anhydrase [Frankia canadensis]SNQ47326.1 Carbonic anhydrase [Frankia canadensis]SOU54616.1 Carbonic anhydrase [Frankia canadensis]
MSTEYRGTSETYQGVAGGDSPEGGPLPTVALEESSTATEALLTYAARNPARRQEAGLPQAPPARPRLGVAVVACMDARLNVEALLGLAEGDAHVLRNAGGVITTDVVRSLAVSQNVLGTKEIILLHHTGCGLEKITDDGFRDQLERDTGVRPEWPVQAFADVEEDVRLSLRILRSSPFLQSTTSVRGFIYQVETGALVEVPA